MTTTAVLKQTLSVGLCRKVARRKHRAGTDEGRPVRWCDQRTETCDVQDDYDDHHHHGKVDDIWMAVERLLYDSKCFEVQNEDEMIWRPVLSTEFLSSRMKEHKTCLKNESLMNINEKKADTPTICNDPPWKWTLDWSEGCTSSRTNIRTVRSRDWTAPATSGRRTPSKAPHSRVYDNEWSL